MQQALLTAAERALQHVGDEQDRQPGVPLSLPAGTVRRAVPLECESREVVVFEFAAERQSAATFAQRHRVLPSTDLTGRVVWPCALVLLSHLRRAVLPGLLASTDRPLRILELGSGTGVLGLGVAAALGRRAAAVVLTDLLFSVGVGASGAPSTSLDFLNETVAANADLGAAAARPLLWGNAEQLAALLAEYGRFDLVVGSELVYRPDCHGALIQTMRTACVGGASVLLAHRERQGLGVDSFHALAAAHFEVREAAGLPVGVRIAEFRLGVA